MTYSVDGIPFDSFQTAVAAAHSVGTVVIESATGIIRWSPAPKPNRKRMRMHQERLAAYQAQESPKESI